MTLLDDQFPDIARVLSGAANWCVVCADNRDVMSLLPPQSIGHIHTDPPYSENLHATVRTNKGRIPGHEAPHYEFGFSHISQQEIEEFVSLAAAVTTRWILIFSDIEESPMIWRKAFADLTDIQFIRTGIWDKPGCTPQISGDRPGVAGDAINIFHRKGRKTWNGGGSHAIWRHPVPRGDNRPDHSTPKPLSLMIELVSLFSDPGDIILDPYCGSGTTGVAAVRLGRRFIGIEREPKWADLSREYIQAESDTTTTKASRMGQMALFSGSKEQGK